MTKEKIHEGEIEYMIICRNDNDSEYLCSTPIKESDLKKYNLKEGSKAQYTIDKKGYAVITGKIIETVKTLI